MDLALLVYAISLLNGIGVFFGILMFALAIAMVASFIQFCSWKFSNSEYSWDLRPDGTLKPKVVASRELGVKILKYSSISVVVFGLFTIFIPTDRTAYMMLGAYAAQKVSQDPKAQEVGEKIMKIANAKLDKYVEEAMQEPKKGKGKRDE